MSYEEHLSHRSPETELLDLDGRDRLPVRTSFPLRSHRIDILWVAQQDLTRWKPGMSSLS